MPGAKQVQVTFDCASPGTVARFWSTALGYSLVPVEDDDDSWAACVDPDGVGPRLYFQRVPEPKAGKNRVHLDVRVGVGLTGEERLAVLEAEGARLVAAGGRRLRLLPADEDNESCLVMADVEGNELCLD